MGGSHSKCDDDKPVEPTMKDGKVVFGENTVESKAAKSGASDFQIVHLPPPVIVVFDNKSEANDQPRLAIVKSGVAVPITDGDSGALTEADMESISLIDAEQGLYVAGSSLGVTHVFRLKQTDGTKFTASLVATGQLPVPKGESTESWQDANRTNIEAVQCKMHEGTLMIGWGGRGGENYAGAETTNHVWLRWAPFDYTTGMVDESKMQETTLRNVGPNEKWRALSSMYLSNGYLYFTSAYDGEEDGHPMKLDDPDRTSEENKAAMKCLVARASLQTGETEILMRLEGLKLEALMVLSDTGSEVKCLLGSDDEGMGSLLGVATFSQSRDCSRFLEPTGPIRFVDIARSSSFYAVEQKRWGTSGMAPLHFAVG